MILAANEATVCWRKCAIAEWFLDVVVEDASNKKRVAPKM